jgi:hypothetical protein
MLAWLSLYGDILSPIIEDCFEDPEDKGEDGEDGVNATGTFSVKMRLKKEIPQLIPMLGKRVSIYYPGIRRLCSKCFEEHSGKFCKKTKVKWIDYVINFIETNKHVLEEAYGRWLEIIEKEEKEKAGTKLAWKGKHLRITQKSEPTRGKHLKPKSLQKLGRRKTHPTQLKPSTQRQPSILRTNQKPTNPTQPNFLQMNQSRNQTQTIMIYPRTIKKWKK